MSTGLPSSLTTKSFLSRPTITLPLASVTRTSSRTSLTFTFSSNGGTSAGRSWALTALARPVAATRARAAARSREVIIGLSPFLRRPRGSGSPARGTEQRMDQRSALSDNTATGGRIPFQSRDLPRCSESATAARGRQAVLPWGRSVSLSSPPREAGVEAPRLGRAHQRLRRGEALAHPGPQALEGGDDLAEPLLVGPAAEAAAERGEAGAEDQREIEVGGAPHHPLLETAGRLVDHRQHHAVDQGAGVGVGDRGVQAEEGVDRRVGLLALAPLVAVEPLAVLRPQPPAAAQPVEPGGDRQAVAEGLGEDVRDLPG